MIQLDPLFADDYESTLTEYAFLPSWTVIYRGTLRVESPSSADRRDRRTGITVRASGDFYRVQQPWDQRVEAPLPPALRRRRTIPRFPIRDYAYYFTIQRAVACGDSLQLTLTTYRFDEGEASWGVPTTLEAHLHCANARPRKGNKEQTYWKGSAANERGTQIGEIQLRLVKKRILRRAMVSVAVVEGRKFHADNGLEGKGHWTLSRVFESVDWEVPKPTVRTIPNEHGPRWERHQLHASMLRWRSKVNLDEHWLYHVLVVPRFKDREFGGFGQMYDTRAIDSNLVPREGVVVGASARFPEDEELYGAAAGEPFEDVQSAYFHSLLHELGHAMGLAHRLVGTGFMQGLIYIARDAEPKRPFPENLGWSFDPEDALRLRHYPDIIVRPGGVAFGTRFSNLPVPDIDAMTDVGDDFELQIIPVRDVLPLGAPLKFHLRLTNTSRCPLPAPKSLNLEGAHVSGKVIGPGFEVHPFVTARRIASPNPRTLQAEMSVYHAATLLRGPRGALLPAPSRYTLKVNVFWRGPGGIATISAATDIMVLEPRDDAHARAAIELLGAREISIPLIFRTPPHTVPPKYRRELVSAIDVLQRTLEVDQLRPYYASIEARRLGDLGEAHLEAAAALIDSTSIVTAVDVEKLLTHVKKACESVKSRPIVQRMVAIFLVKAEALVARDLATHDLVELARSMRRS